MSVLALLGLGNEELLVVFFVLILLFGASAIPKLARSLGQAKGQFQQAKREFDAEAAKGEAAATMGTSATGLGATDDQVRQTAANLGIATEGKTTDELKRLIAQKLA